MKKMCAALLALLLAFTVLGTALAQDSGRVSDEARALYDSRWFSENAYVDITPQDGEFKVATAGNTAPSSTRKPGGWKRCARRSNSGRRIWTRAAMTWWKPSMKKK